MNTKDEFKEFLTKIKELLSELEAFVQIRNDIKNNAAMTQDYRKKQTEINGEIAKYSSIDKEVISIGFFKKANKKDLVAQLKRDLEEVS
jgi:effector-binding domain-containing protein